jgi:hypothetical protein
MALKELLATFPTEDTCREYFFPSLAGRQTALSALPKVGDSLQHRVALEMAVLEF